MQIKQIGNIGKLKVGDKKEIVHNRFGGGSCELEPEAVAVYDLTIGAEALGDYETVRKCLDYFQEHWPKEYMILLD